MTTPKPQTKRSLIIDLILGAALVIIILTGAATSIFTLIFRPERDAWQIALDWIQIAITAAVVAFFVFMGRRIFRDLDRQAAQKAQLQAEIRASHGVAGHGQTSRKMTPDELEEAGLSRDFHAGRA